MTFGKVSTVAERKLVRVQEKGQVTLPAEFRRRLGLKKGDLVAVTETSAGVLIAPQEVIATRMLEEIGKALEERGLSLEELIDSGRDEPGQLRPEPYGTDAEQQDS